MDFAYPPLLLTSKGTSIDGSKCGCTCSLCLSLGVSEEGIDGGDRVDVGCGAVEPWFRGLVRSDRL